MLLLGHTGITLSAAVILTATLGLVHSSGETSSQTGSWFVVLGRYLDIRLLMVGSLLPDIIDKPVGLFLFRETYSSGTIFSHTLLFLTVLTLAGFYLYSWRNKGWPLVLAFGTFAHLIFDGMWRSPRTLFWPVFGFAFRREPDGWISAVFHGLLTDPEAYVPELVGGIILLWFVFVLVRRRRVFAFIRHGWG